MKLQKGLYYLFVVEGSELDGEYEGKFVGESFDQSPDGNGEKVYFFDIGETRNLMVYPWEVKTIEII